MTSYASVGDLRLAYETFGEPGGRPLLLIMGLASQMLLWDEEFCARLVAEGHFVVRFDNRDVGLSTLCHDLGKPSVTRAIFDARRGRPVQTAYTLDDMVDDVIGLLDALSLPRAHLVGASMGGMLAQLVAFRYPERVLSLTSALSSTGDPRLPLPTWKAMRALIQRPPKSKELYLDYTVKLWRAIGSPGYPFDEAAIRRRSERIYERGLSLSGAARQLVAIIADGDRTARLERLELPSLVIHGLEDPLVPVAAGRATAKAIPGAELMLLEGVGHTLPPEVWPQVTGAVGVLTRRAESQAEANFT